MQSRVAPHPEFIRSVCLHTILLLRPGKEASNVKHMWKALALGVPLDTLRIVVHRQCKCPIADCGMAVEVGDPEVHGFTPMCCHVVFVFLLHIHPLFAVVSISRHSVKILCECGLDSQVLDGSVASL